MSAHTPGPWELRKAGRDTEDGEDRCFDYVRVAPNRYIVTEGRNQDEANANARLCSAAPELYAQLEYAVKLLEGLPGFAGTAQVDAMRAALVKSVQS